MTPQEFESLDMQYLYKSESLIAFSENNKKNPLKTPESLRNGVHRW